MSDQYGGRGEGGGRRLDGVVLGQEEVLELEVGVDDTTRVHKRQRVCRRARAAHFPARTKTLCLATSGGERPP